MKSIFEPLLHANAKAFAILGGVLFVGMLGWGGYTEYAASRDAKRAAEEAARRSDESIPTFEEAEPIGLLAYVKSQTETGTEDAHLPIDLFRCPIDSEGNPVRPGTTITIQPQPEPDAETEALNQDIQDLFERAQTSPSGDGNRLGPGPGGNRPPRQPRNHELSYGGYFKRTDGTLAALVTDKGTGQTSFVKDGDEVAGATIVGSDGDKLRVRLADGTEHDLVRGGEPLVTGQIPPPPGETQAQSRQGRRLPTEDEIKEIEKRDPELAQRIRNAIRRRNERQQKGNP